MNIYYTLVRQKCSTDSVSDSPIHSIDMNMDMDGGWGMGDGGWGIGDKGTIMDMDILDRGTI
jgi:hypothetical protein